MKITKRQLRRLIKEEISLSKRVDEGLRREGGNLDTSLLEKEAWWPQLKRILLAMDPELRDSSASDD